MTDERLRLIRQRAEAATPVDRVIVRTWIDGGRELETRDLDGPLHDYNAPTGTQHGDQRNADVAFFASARGDVLALLEEVEPSKNRIEVGANPASIEDQVGEVIRAARAVLEESSPVTDGNFTPRSLMEALNKAVQAAVAGIG
jgi:hypothetical protein